MEMKIGSNEEWMEQSWFFEKIKSANPQIIKSKEERRHRLIKLETKWKHNNIHQWNWENH